MAPLDLASIAFDTVGIEAASASRGSVADNYKDEINPLIMSSVFHYEFVFIHPFSDGNGRMARLWQNVILSKWREIFKYVTIENQIKKYQNEYYEAINTCNINGDSTIFIEFMLKMINNTLEELVITTNNKDN